MTTLCALGGTTGWHFPRVRTAWCLHGVAATELHRAPTSLEELPDDASWDVVGRRPVVREIGRRQDGSHGGSTHEPFIFCLLTIVAESMDYGMFLMTPPNFPRPLAFNYAIILLKFVCRCSQTIGRNSTSWFHQYGNVLNQLLARGVNQRFFNDLRVYLISC